MTILDHRNVSIANRAYNILLISLKLCFLLKEECIHVRHQSRNNIGCQRLVIIII